MGPKDKPSLFSNFCPEVSFDTFGWFASNLASYADEIDADFAHRRLAKEGASVQDWRWAWSQATPTHYTECPLYSPLLLGINDAKEKASIGFKANS